MSWSLTGNAGTSPPTDFLGTPVGDNKALSFKTVGVERLRIREDGIVQYVAGAGRGLAVTTSVDGGGISLSGSTSENKSAGIRFNDDGTSNAAIGFASGPGAWINGSVAGDLVLNAVTGNLWLGANGTAQMRIDGLGANIKGGLTLGEV